jgi:hypothetical protein
VVGSTVMGGPHARRERVPLRTGQTPDAPCQNGPRERHRRFVLTAQQPTSHFDPGAPEPLSQQAPGYGGAWGQAWGATRHGVRLSGSPFLGFPTGTRQARSGG